MGADNTGTGLALPASVPRQNPAREGRPSPSGTLDFRRGDEFLPLKKGGEEGFWNESFGQIPLTPPFSKGE